MTADLSPLRLLLVTLAGWVNRHQQEVIEYLVEENRVLREQLKGRRVRLTDDQRRRLAGEGPATRSPDPEAGRDHRDTRHDPALAPAPDRPEVDVRAEAARPSREDEGDRVAHCADGHGQSSVRLQSHPGRVEESRPSRREKVRSPRCSNTTGSRPRRAARRRGAPFCGLTGARSPEPTSSRRKSGRLVGY